MGRPHSRLLPNRVPPQRAPRSRAPRSRALAVALAAGVLLALAACTPSGGSAPSGSPSATGGRGGASSATGSPSSPTPSATPVRSKPIAVGCSTLVSPQVMYDFNPNFALLPTPTLQPGSQAATVASEGGLVCQWQNTTSRDLLTVAVAELPAAELTRLKNEDFENSQMVPTYGVEGYFLSNSDNVGEAEAFDRSYWISAVSPAFLEPGDASDIIAAAISALP